MEFRLKLRIENEINYRVPADGTFSEHQASDGGVGIGRGGGEHRYQTTYLEHFRNNIQLTAFNLTVS